jgi:hypothetical protein
MFSKKHNNKIKPLLHIIGVMILTTIFVILNITGEIEQDTNVVPGIGFVIDQLLSLKIIYIIPPAIFLIIFFPKLRKNYGRFRSRSIKTTFIFLALLMGKVYTVSAFFWGWGISALFVSFIEPYPNWFLIGLMGFIAVFLNGIIMRALILKAWRY